MMRTQNQDRNDLQQVPLGRQMVLFIGFVTFITGLFSFGYALSAWILLPFSNNILLIACTGLIATYLGRKTFRRGRLEITL